MTQRRLEPDPPFPDWGTEVLETKRAPKPEPRRAAPAEPWPPWVWAILIVEGAVILFSGFVLVGLIEGWWSW